MLGHFAEQSQLRRGSAVGSSFMVERKVEALRVIAQREELKVTTAGGGAMGAEFLGVPPPSIYAGSSTICICSMPGRSLCTPQPMKV